MSTAKPPLDGFQITKFGLLVLGIALFGAFLRLYSLDRMAFHHDESIHALYSHHVYMGNLQAYRYDPTYHGPFLYHFGALTFTLFGDNDYVARLPFAISGVLLLYFVWRLRPWLGRYGALFALLFTAISPVMAYFSRFAREDIHMAMLTMGVLLYGLEYIRSRSAKHLCALAFFLTLMYSTKENSYMTGFILGSFLVFYGLYHVLSTVRVGWDSALRDLFVDRAPLVQLTTLYAIFSFTAFSLVYWVSHNRHFSELAETIRIQRARSTLEMPILHSAWDQFLPTKPWVYPVWIGAAIFVTVAFFLLFAIIRKRLETPREGESFFSALAKNNLPLALALLVIVSVYCFLFTTMGTNPGGVRDGIIDYLLYWMGQQGAPRIPGPPDYFFGRLLIYEFAAVVFGVIAYLVYTWRAFGPANFIAFQFAVVGVSWPYWMMIQNAPPSIWVALLIALLFLSAAAGVYVARTFFNLSAFVSLESRDEKLEESNALMPDGVRWLFIYWSLTSVLIYAMLNEKVPWLAVHQAQPLLLLAGVFMGDLYARLRPGFLRGTFVVILCLFAVYEARASWQFILHRPDDARELLVYTQCSPDVKEFVSEVKETAKRLGREYRPLDRPLRPGEQDARRPIIAIHRDVSWPYTWYFRHYRYVIFEGAGMPPAEIPFVLTEAHRENQMRVWARGEYARRPIRHHVWWQPPGDNGLPFRHFAASNRPTDAWSALWRYFMYRETWTPTGERTAFFYWRTTLFEPEEAPQVPQGYERPPMPLSVQKMTGFFGSGEGDFNEPRGIALSPDEQTLYVLDARNGRIQVFDTELNYQGQMGSPGSGPGQFTVDVGNGPNGGIDIGPDGVIYATDTWYNVGGHMGRILRFQPDGTPMEPLLPGSETFYFPRGLAVAPDGTLYVADTGRHRIARFSPNGQYLGTFVEGVFQEPVGLAVGPDGRLYVCDVAGKRVISFSPQGAFVKQWTLMGWSPPTPGIISWIEPYVALDPEDNVYITDSTTDTLHLFHQHHDIVFQYGGTGTGMGQLRGPKGLAVDSQYTIYIADSQNHRIIKAKALPPRE